MTSTIGVKKIQHTNGTQVMTFDTDGKISSNVSSTGNITTTGTVNTPSINGGQIGGRRNIIINGAMQVAQRATSATGLGNANDYAVVDRFRFNFANTAGRFTASQVASGLSGFGNALKLDCTTADTSIASNEFGVVQYNIEGQDLQQFKKGTSDAEKYTLSFYVKGTAKTYAVELFDGDNNRHVSSLFNVTTSWNRISITFPADTTGAYDDDNATSLSINFALHMGSDTTSGTLQTTWGALSATARYAGIDSFFSSTDNEFFLTGVQLEVGEQATSFEHRSFAEELVLCERYFQLFTHNGSGGGNITNGMISSTRFYGVLQFKKDMRAIPTITTTSSGFNVTSSAHTVGSLSIDETHNTTIHACRLRTGTNGSFSNGQAAILRFDSGSINIDAEL